MVGIDLDFLYAILKETKAHSNSVEFDFDKERKTLTIKVYNKLKVMTDIFTLTEM